MNPRTAESAKAMSPIRVGISACLLGQEVRFDGGHKRDRYITDTLGKFFEWVPVCPEVEMGLTTPRETLRLVGEPGAPRLVFFKTGGDITDGMQVWAEGRLDALARMDLSGYLLKSDSPSCGMERVRIYRPTGIPGKDGVGVFARALLQRFPLLPVEEEGRLVANAKGVSLKELETRYGELFMAGLRVKASAKKHTNVMHHILGYLKKELGPPDKAELLAVIADYHHGLVPLVVPLTLFKHHLARNPLPYIQDQVYLSPHPKELMLRNHV